MLTLSDFKKFFELIEESKSILILNSKPDGDSIGASLALNLILKKLNKEVKSITPQQVPDYLSILTEKGPIKFVDLLSESFNQYDLVIIVDSSELSRCTLNKVITFNSYAKFICIDHHQPGSKLNLNLALVDPKIESTCGLITDLFIEFKAQKAIDVFDKDIAFLLYAGLVSDTDYFGYSNVTKDTFERAAYLLGYEFDVIPIIRQFRETLDYKAFKFIQRNIGKVIVNEEKNYSYLKLKKSDLTEEDNIVVISEATNYINRALIRIIDIVNFSFVIKEINDNRCSIGMRLHNNGNKVNLSKIAGHFGGGGHIQAAGAVIDMNIDDFEVELINYLNRTL